MKKLVPLFLFANSICPLVLPAQQADSLENPQIVQLKKPAFARTDSSSRIYDISYMNNRRGQIDNPMQLLQGTASGLIAARAGSDPNDILQVMVHGLSSLSQSNQPLVFVDGVPVSDVNLLRMEDIGNIRIVKDAASTAIYGAGGAQGVVLIETRHSAVKGWGASYSNSVSAGSSCNSLQALSAQAYTSYGGTELFPGVRTNWTDQILRNSFTHTHHLSLQGNMNRFGWRASAGYQDRQGILQHSGYRQLNGRLDATYRSANNKWHLQAGGSGYFRNANLSHPQAFQYAINANPTMPVKSTQFPQYGGYAQTNAFDVYNPVAILEQNVSLAESGSWQAHARAQWRAGKNITWTSALAHQFAQTDYGEYHPANSPFRSQQRGIAVLGYEQPNTSYAESVLQLRKNISTSILEMDAGLSGRWHTAHIFRKAGGGIDPSNRVSNIHDIYQLNVEDFSLGSFFLEDTTLKYHTWGPFARLALSNGEVWDIQAGLRYENASNLKKKSILLPFAALSYDIARRLDWKSIQHFTFQGGLGIAASPAQNHTKVAYLANERWERRSEAHGALLLSTWQNRLHIRFNHWINRAGNVAFPSSPYYIGFNIPKDIDRQSLEITNNGTDFDLVIQPLNTRRFQWQTHFTYSRLRTGLSHFLPDPASVSLTQPGAPGNGSIFYHRIEENTAWGELYAAELKNIELGAPVFKDLNNDGVVSPDIDARAQGSGAPQRWIGWSNKLRFHSFELSFLLRGAYGHKIVHEYRAFYETVGSGFYNTIETKYLDPRKTIASPFYADQIENASFIRLENIQLQYKLPLGKHKIEVFAGVNNLFTLSGYSGNDPEVRFYSETPLVANGFNFTVDNSIWGAGIDRRGTYWLEKQFFVGISLRK